MTYLSSGIEVYLKLTKFLGTYEPYVSLSSTQKIMALTVYRRTLIHKWKHAFITNEDFGIPQPTTNKARKGCEHFFTYEIRKKSLTKYIVKIPSKFYDHFEFDWYEDQSSTDLKYRTDVPELPKAPKRQIIN